MPRRAFDIEKLPERLLFGVVWARGITWRRTDAAVLLRDQVFVRRLLVPGVSPPFGARAQVQSFRGCLGKPIRQRLEQDRGVIVVGRGESLEMRLDADTGGHREPADVIRNSGLDRCDEIRQA